MVGFDLRVEELDEARLKEQKAQNRRVMLARRFEDQRLAAQEAFEHKNGYCPKCFSLLRLNGLCDNCD